MATDQQRLEAAFRRYGPTVDHISQVEGYGISGAALLAKLTQGESGGSGTAVSPAGAKAWTQFMPGSRRIAISKYGVDPWRSPEEAVHAAALHLRGLINGSIGLKGYNPGDPSYTSYILGQKVGNVGAGGSGALIGGSAPTTPGAPTPSTVGTAPATDVSALKAALAAASKPQLQLTNPQAPAFAAGPVLPAGAQPMPSAPPTPPSPLQLPAQTDLSSMTPVGVAGGEIPVTAPGTAGEKPAGKLVIAAGANRNGAKLQSGILGFLHQLAQRSGRAVTVTTGTNHNRYVAGEPGVQSDHWDGNATDLGLGGDARQDPHVAREGDLIAAHAIADASGMAFGKALELARAGGVWNFETPQGRVQVLWKTMQGGNHFNHVHIGVNPGR